MTTKDIKFWLEEKDLKTPIHDEMVLWTFNNAEKIMGELGIFDGIEIRHQHSNESYNSPKWDWDKKEAIHENEEMKKEVLEDYNIFLKKVNSEKRFEYSKEIEHALSGYNNWNIGFIDLFVKTIPNTVSSKYFCELINSEELIYEGSYGKKHYFGVYFEIKPEVKSIGETMRQINFYRKYAKGFFVLVTKTKGLKEIFKSQNVFVYEYEGEEDGKGM